MKCYKDASKSSDTLFDTNPLCKIEIEFQNVAPTDVMKEQLNNLLNEHVKLEN